jgi:hypothetical protein
MVMMKLVFVREKDALKLFWILMAEGCVACMLQLPVQSVSNFDRLLGVSYTQAGAVQTECRLIDAVRRNTVSKGNPIKRQIWYEVGSS